MAAKKVEMSPKSSSRIRVVTYVLAIYHLVLSIILFIEYSVELTKRKNCCREISNYIRLDIISSYLLLLVLLLISICLLWGVMVNRGYLVMPFLALQTMDFILSLLMFCSVYNEKPSNQATNFEVNLAYARLKDQGPVWQSFEMCVRLLTFFSCYVEVPTYLDLKPISYMSYFTLNNLPYQKYSTRLIIFTLLHAAVILNKALMIWCIWKIFKSLNTLGKKQDSPPLQDLSKVALPSYEEAVKTSKDSPPPYSTA